jgi:ribosomal protein S18 acetylase RimI-like enzyme
MQIVIRRATIDDAAPLTDLLAELGYAVPADQVAHQLASEPGSTFLVAVVDMAVVGLIGISTRHQLHKGTRVSTIDEMVVTSSMRGRGVGRALVEAAVVVARQQGASRLDLHSRADRTDAHRFYERMGFDTMVPAHYFARRVP